MRGMMLVACFSLTGCLYGASHGRTTTSYVNDDGIHPIQRTTVTQTSDGSMVGASLPLMYGGVGYVGGMYGAGGMMMGGGYGGGNTACVLHPDRCAGVYTATVVQPITVTSSGGSYVGGAGQAGTYAETDDSELTAMLAKHEKVISILAGGAKQKARQICQILIANPEAITDLDERKEVIAACQDDLAKHPYQQKEEK